MSIIDFSYDLINLCAFQKLFGHIVAMLIIVAACDIRLISLYGILVVLKFQIFKLDPFGI